MSQSTENKHAPVFLSHIQTAVPTCRLSQEDIVERQIRLWDLNQTEAARLRVLYQRTGIKTRYTAFDQWKSGSDQAVQDWLSSDISTKMLEYRQAAVPLAVSVASQTIKQIKKEQIKAIVTVSCTGLYAPGLEIDLINQLGLAADTAHYAVNYVGCYAMFPAIEFARVLAKSLEPEQAVLVVGVELCSLHYERNYSPDAVLAHALFADGATAFLVSAYDLGDSSAFEVSQNKSILIPAEEDMAWQVGPTNFLMKLSTYVPKLLAPAVKDILPSGPAGYTMAIHPGGRKILEVVQEAAQLQFDDFKASYEVMKAYGNMSSVTIMFVLAALLKQTEIDRSKPVFAAGFGPGLTLTATTFRFAHV